MPVLRSKSTLLPLTVVSVVGLEAPSAWAQQPIALPGITVQGATLDVKPSAPAAAAPVAAQPKPADETAASGAGDGGIPADRIGSSVSVITRGI